MNRWENENLANEMDANFTKVDVKPFRVLVQQALKLLRDIRGNRAFNSKKVDSYARLELAMQLGFSITVVSPPGSLSRTSYTSPSVSGPGLRTSGCFSLLSLVWHLVASLAPESTVCATHKGVLIDTNSQICTSSLTVV
eukprot:145039-Prorocentrum_minimum.AAC.1